MFSEKETKLLKLLGAEFVENIEERDIDFENSTKYIEEDIFFLNNGIMVLEQKKEVKEMISPKILKIKEEMNANKIYIISESNFTKFKSKLIQNNNEEIDFNSADEDSEDNDGFDNSAADKLLYEILFSAKIRGVSDIHILPKKNKTVIKFRENGSLVVYKEFQKHYKSLNSKYNFWRKCRIKSTTNTLDDLGFEPEDLETYRENFKNPYGMILNVGATGQGKTTTFYLTINELFQMFPDKNISTAEDPVEIVFENAVQFEINDTRGLTFAKVLKALLRQDPDIILIGEIRDEETAEIDKKEISVTEFMKEKYNLKTDKVYEANGCPSCHNTGYKGRAAVIEVLEVNEALKVGLAENRSEIELKRIIKDQGFQNLWKNGLKKVERGEISISELERVIKPDSIYDSKGD